MGKPGKSSAVCVVRWSEDMAYLGFPAVFGACRRRGWM